MLLQNLQLEFAEMLAINDTDSSLLNPAGNLQIYYHNVTSNLIHTLQNTYPLIEKLVGSEFFKIAAKEYISRYPSVSSNLHDYGEYVSDFLAEYAPVKNLIYLAEIAQFEWICHTLFFAADHDAFSIEKLRDVTPQQYHQLYFSLHPASCVRKFYYPILQIIDLCKNEHLDDVNIDAGGVHLLIIRREFETMLVELNQADYAFLTALANHQSLSSALDAALYFNPDFNLEEKLPQWIQDKTIVDCHLIANWDA